MLFVLFLFCTCLGYETFVNICNSGIPAMNRAFSAKFSDLDEHIVFYVLHPFIVRAQPPGTSIPSFGPLWLHPLTLCDATKRWCVCHRFCPLLPPPGWYGRAAKNGLTDTLAQVTEDQARTSWDLLSRKQTTLKESQKSSFR